MKGQLEVILFFGLLISAACSSNSIETPKQPNVLFILADDLGYHDLSCMGSTFYETPNIDQIAQKGITFTNGYAACQVCSPSRASLMTGKFPARHGITDWLGAKTGEDWRGARRFTKLLPPNYVAHLQHDETTIAEAFKEQDYQTFFAGKWHLGEQGSYPEDHGFDINKGGYEKGGPYSGGFFSPFNNPKMEDHPGEKGMPLPMKLAKETATFIKGNKDKPFFAMLSFYAVHAPIQTTQNNWKKYQQKVLIGGVDSLGFKMERRFPIRKQQDNPVYAGLIEHMDDAVGYILNTLQEQGLDKNTIVVFTSDNGGVASGDNYSTSNFPLRGGKGYQWEGGLRVPYLVYVPWLKNAPKKVDTPVSGTDFYPSFLDLANLPLKPEQHKDGQSFVPALSNKDLPERSLVWHYPHYGNQGGDPSSIIRKGKWKLIQYHETNQVELYDLESGVKEAESLSKSNLEITKALSIELKSYLKSVHAKQPVEDPSFSADSLAIKQNYFKTTVKNRLEQQRTEMLQDNWQPNADWWGSAVVKD